ncbi:MAG TPA: glycosyltransferase family 2 protein [Chloroflexota bacterium]|jgi:glycosyltransferase involved in cell wall biosynthesis
MYKERSVYLVVPCYNVAPQVGGVIAAMPDFVDGLVAVDDGSKDDTAAVLREALDGRVLLVCHPENRGLGAAMATGFQKAVELGAEIMVKVDGDGQMDLAYLPALLDPLVEESYPYAKGNRLFDADALAAMPRVRLLGNFVLTFLTKLASGYWHVVDPQNGYVAIQRRTWELLDHRRIASGYFFENDMLVHLNLLRARVKDVPMPARYQDERSSLRVGRIIPQFTWLLLRRTLYRFYMKYMLRDFSPIALFVLTGLPLFLWGAAFGAWAWWDSARQGLYASTGTVMLSVLPLLVGFQLLLQALVLDIQESPR